MGIKTLLDRNIYISDFSRKVGCRKYNSEMLKFVSDISQIDSISNYDEFTKALNHIPKQINGTSYTIKRAFSENCMYGYASELMNYAGLNNKNMLYLPILEHGINFSNEIGYGYKTRMSYIFQGRSKQKIWEANKKLKQAYYVGPYIHYSRDFYEEKIINDILKEDGKILLIYPPHSTEYGATELYLDSFNQYVFSHLAKQYDSIYACIFWSDVNTPYTKWLISQGVKPVSAGFKIDPLFVRRMKSLLKMSATVLFPSFCTAIGYAYYLNKHVIYVDYEDCVKDIYSQNNVSMKIYDDGIARNKKRLSQLFAEDQALKTKEKDEFVNLYWGLSDIKTQSEIEDIYYKNKKAIKHRLGF